MGLGDLTPETEDEEEQTGGQSTHIKFENPRNVEISEGHEHRHKQEYYDAVQTLRNMMGPNLNVPIGEFAVAAVEAEKGNNEPLEELFEQIAADDEAAE